MEYTVDIALKELLKKRLINLEDHQDADVLSYVGPIRDGNEHVFRHVVEQLAYAAQKRDRLLVLLTTKGGSAVAVERYVNIIREHYSEVDFLVPDQAYSAGTIFCMSGNRIFMDYYSVLGPIDPQVQNKEGRWVPALGYLDKVNEMLAKAKAKRLTEAELVILNNLDLAELRGYEQAKELTISLLKKWLVQYKFKSWDIHRSDEQKRGQPVTQQEKTDRAQEIANKLSNNNLWKSHGRPINIETLEKELRLKVEDFGADAELSKLVKEYHELLADYHSKVGGIVLQTRNFIN